MKARRQIRRGRALAGDWIKLEAVTPDKPEIHSMAERLGIPSEQVLGGLCRVWIWADQQSISGNALSVTENAIDRISCVPKLASAMRAEGWITGTEGRLCLPNFDRHNGKTAKQRALTNKRVETHRKRGGNDDSVTPALPEKRREERTPIPPSGGFLRFWGAWPKSARKQSRGPCWDRWRKADLDIVADDVIAHVEAMKLSIDWRKDGGAFIPAPLVYLNQRRWEGADLSPGGEKRMVV